MKYGCVLGFLVIALGVFYLLAKFVVDSVGFPIMIDMWRGQNLNQLQKAVIVAVNTWCIASALIYLVAIPNTVWRMIRVGTEEEESRSTYFHPSERRSLYKSLDEHEQNELDNRIAQWRRTLEHQIGRKVLLKAECGMPHYHNVAGRVEQVEEFFVVIHQTDPYELHDWIALENVRAIEPLR